MPNFWGITTIWVGDVDNEQPAPDRQSTLSQVLIALAAENGVQRNDLLEVLSGELREYWGIAPNERNVETVRAYVTANLKKLIRYHIKPVRTSGAAAYENSVMASFNVLGLSELQDTTPTARREWVQKRANPRLRVSEKSSRTWLTHAIKQIEQILVSGKYAPASLDEFESLRVARPNVRESTVYPAPSDREVHSSGDQLQAPTTSNQVEKGQSVQTAHPPSPALPPKRRPLWKTPIALTATAILIFAAGTVGVLTLHNSGTTQADCGAAASALTIKQPSEPNAYGGWNAVYAADQRDRAREFLGRVDRVRTPPKNYDQFLNEELDAGAYLYEGMKLQIELTGLDQREVIIRNMRPVVHKRAAVPVEAAIFLPAQGTSSTGVHFAMDDAHPIARMKYADEGIPEGTPLFDVKRFAVSQGQTESFTLYFDARYSAFVFDVAIDYEADGVTCTRILNRNGQPFRVAAAACPALFVTDKNHNRNVQSLRALRYGEIRDTVDFDDKVGDFVFGSVDPEIYASRCNESTPYG